MGRRAHRGRHVYSVLLALSSRPERWSCRRRGSGPSLHLPAGLGCLSASLQTAESLHLEVVSLAPRRASANDRGRRVVVIDYYKYLRHYIMAMARRSLAARLSLSLIVLCAVSAAILPATKKPPLKPVNLNSATSEELQEVPGIGPATAEKILQMRKSYGPFKSVDDLLAIRGIGKKRLDKMRKYLTAGKSPASSKSRPSTSCAGCSKATAAPVRIPAPPDKPSEPSPTPATLGEPEEPPLQ